MSLASSIRTRVSTPLGVVFADEANNSPIIDGLRVTCARVDGFPGATVARAVPAGAWVFDTIPGYSRFEEWFATNHPTVEVEVRADDPLGRFMPARFRTSAPQADPFPPGGALLMSAPSRRIGSRLVAVHAELIDDAAQPVRFARVDVMVGGVTHFGMSDEMGRVVVALPRPAGAGPWQATLSVRWTPEALLTPTPRALPLVTEWESQPPRSLLATVGGQATANVTKSVESSGDCSVWSDGHPEKKLVVNRA